MLQIFLRSLLIFCILWGTVSPAFAEATPTPPTPPPLFSEDSRVGAEMDGIRFADYVDFHKKWKIVTFTYRSDLHELRVVYANPLAYETLAKGSTDYPDGATCSPKFLWLSVMIPPFQIRKQQA